jgi:UDP-N-acetylmuramoyl-tripeptide--D-alanyl-D-alanine ligase
MNNLLYFFICILWLVAICRLVLLQTAVWQLKEYRWDRMREYLRLGSTAQMFMSPIELAKWLLLFLFFVGNTLFGLYPWFVLIIYVLDLLLLIKELRQHTVLRPTMTVKALCLIVLTILVVLILLGLIFVNNLFLAGLFILLDRLIVVIVAVFVFLFFPLTYFLKMRKISMAKNKRENLRLVIAIGITGSYGKSGTKNVLETILNGEDLLVTPGNTNTEIGVAQLMLKRLTGQTKYFVAEMGAYRIGEIKSLAKLVKPKIGILTAVGNQHLGLFGSRENIRKAKYELIEALPQDGTAIFNADDSVCLELAKKTTHCEVLTYGLSDEADLQAKIISSNENGIEIKIFGLVPETNLVIPVVGQHQIGNVLAGIVAGIVVGKKWPDIQTKLQNIKMVKQTMEKYTTTKGAVIIDDSYNANVEGVIAAIENLKSFSQSNKIVILTPMIELGGDSKKAHELVGATLARTATHVYYTGIDFQKDLIAGSLSNNSDFKIEIQTQPSEIVKKLYPILGKNTVVLLEGRVPKFIRESLRII